MPKVVKELTDVEVRRLRHRGGNKDNDPQPVGGVAGLYLNCKRPPPGQDIGGRSWILRVPSGDTRVSSNGKPYAVRSDFGLGSYPEVTLSTARDRAREYKDMLRRGIDPVAHYNALQSARIAEKAKLVTFREVAKEYVAKKSAEYKPGTTYKQTQKLTTQLDLYVDPILGRMVVGDIEHAHIMQVLEPIWSTKHETAARVRLHVERILDLAGIKGLRTGDNPAATKRISQALPARKKIAPVQSYTALPVDAMPDFWRALSERGGAGADALRFIILTAARSGEARGATWDEIDLDAKLWTIPADRMKGGEKACCAPVRYRRLPAGIPATHWAAHFQRPTRQTYIRCVGEQATQSIGTQCNRSRISCHFPHMDTGAHGLP